MEELTLQDIEAQEPQQEALIEVVQLPVIVEHLHQLKGEIEQQTKQAMSLVCSPETVTTVKSTRADLNKRFSELEEDRKKVKAAIMERYDQFEAVYKECVSGPFKTADAFLKRKINEAEHAIINACREEMRTYYNEMAASYHIDWLPFERMGLRIGMTDAKQKRHQKLREAIAAYLLKVAEETRSISTMDNAEEIMVEYKKSLDLAGSISVVSERKKRVEEEKRAQQEREAQRKAEEEAVARVEAAAPIPAPVPIPEPVAAPVAPEKVYKLNFSISGTKPQLIEFKKNFVAYCEERGICYE